MTAATSEARLSKQSLGGTRPEAEPKRFTVRHVSTYRYAEPVAFGEHRMMFRPRASHDLRLVATDLVITPAPARLHWLHDVFDNSVAVANFDREAAELRFESRVVLEHIEAPMPEYALEPYAAVWPFLYTDAEASDLVKARNRQYPAPDIDGWARSFLPPEGAMGTMALLRAMTFAIKSGFRYVRRTEKGVQHPVETLQQRSGSCRDFAVLMMEAVRALGLAARFVSGYIFVPDRDATQGGGATHAWLQIYLPGAGWVDFDPTNSIVGNRHLIRVAVAWEHQQALPLWGTWSGPADAFDRLEVEVSVTEEATSCERPPL
jgi:transglutaminase-like putative cysteine protease